MTNKLIENDAKIYSVVVDTPMEKYILMDICRKQDVPVVNVSGYGNGYYIEAKATPEQAQKVDTLFQAAMNTNYYDSI